MGDNVPFSWPVDDPNDCVPGRGNKNRQNSLNHLADGHGSAGPAKWCLVQPTETIMTATPEWIPVGALGDAFTPDNHCLPLLQDVDRQTAQLHYEDGENAALAFDGSTLEWTSAGSAPGSSRTAHCRVTRPRDGVFFIDYLEPGKQASSVSLVLNTHAGTFIEVAATLPTKEESLMPLLQRAMLGLELTGVKERIRRGTIGRPFTAGAALPESTTELLGKRVEYLYSPHERYEHIYLNARFYTWRCIAGSELGLTDTDACDYYRIDDELYLFIWREKIVPTVGVIMVDLRAMKTTGKIMGYEGHDFLDVRNFGVGAHARVLSTIAAA